MYNQHYRVVASPSRTALYPHAVSDLSETARQEAFSRRAAAERRQHRLELPELQQYHSDTSTFSSASSGNDNPADDPDYIPSPGMRHCAVEFTAQSAPGHAGQTGQELCCSYNGLALNAVHERTLGFASR